MSLESEDIALLEQERIIIQAGGKRTVSGAYLSPPSSLSSTSLSSAGSSPVSLRLWRFTDPSPKYINLPLEEVSVSALEWIGFNNETAEKIISHYASRPDPDQNPDELLDYVYSHVRGKSQQQDRPAIETMASMGLRQDFQNALTDPRFESIQGTETLRFWIEDTLRINYLTMIVLQGRLKKTAELIKAGKKKGKRASLPHAASIFQPEASSSQSPSTTTTLSMTAANQSIPEQHNLPATYVSVEAAGPILHDHVVLYKARAACDMEDLILEDGRFNLSSLQTYSGGDFNHLRGAWY